ncbi:hypothetical protein CHH45_01840 [Paraclostridium bifermentans]|nr:hypothetical protein CHH45_01840 [Paraclostridium bifermentans]
MERKTFNKIKKEPLYKGSFFILLNLKKIKLTTVYIKCIYIIYTFYIHYAYYIKEMRCEIEYKYK